MVVICLCVGQNLFIGDGDLLFSLLFAFLLPAFLLLNLLELLLAFFSLLLLLLHHPAFLLLHRQVLLMHQKALLLVHDVAAAVARNDGLQMIVRHVVFELLQVGLDLLHLLEAICLVFEEHQYFMLHELLVLRRVISQRLVI